MNKTFRVLAALAVGVALSSPAWAQRYPARPIHFLLGFPPGGSTDLIARLLAAKMETALGQSIIVENRPGNSGTIAANAVVKADPDGYTLFFGSVTIVAPFLVKNGAVTGGIDLAPISVVTASPFFMLVRSDLPAQSLQQFLAYAKSNSGKLNYGSASTVNTMAGEVFKNRAGLGGTAIPYKGAAAVAAALAAGEVDYTLDALPAYVPLIQAGKIRYMFVSGSRRSSFVPEVPSADELGLPNLEVVFRLSLWAPIRTPKATLDALSAQVQAAIKDPEVAAGFKKAGAEGIASTPEELQKAYEGEMKFWSEAARLAHFEAQ